jgi:hypothetical protein
MPSETHVGSPVDTRPLTHDELLTLARKVQAAAHDNDAHRLAYARVRLAGALTTHLEAEHEALERVPEPQRELLARGRHRLVHLLSELAKPTRAEQRRDHSDIADDLLHALGLQAADEHRSMRTAVATKTDPRGT